MVVSARPAMVDDVASLVTLYRSLEAEQTGLKDMWPLADGLPEPIEEALEAIIGDPRSYVGIGCIDDVPVGFVWGRSEGLLVQAGDRRVGVIRLIFTDHEARGIGVGDAMMTAVLTDMRGRGLTLFDAKVLPGHRHAKNFFEANGFAARLITMHRADEEG